MKNKPKSNSLINRGFRLKRQLITGSDIPLSLKSPHSSDSRLTIIFQILSHVKS